MFNSINSYLPLPNQLSEMAKKLQQRLECSVTITLTAWSFITNIDEFDYEIYIGMPFKKVHRFNSWGELVAFYEEHMGENHNDGLSS